MKRKTMRTAPHASNAFLKRVLLNSFFLNAFFALILNGALLRTAEAATDSLTRITSPEMVKSILASEGATTFILVRHAEKAMNGSPDPDLTEAGRSRAAELARLLSAVKVSHIYTTPFKRTHQTVAPVEDAQSAAITEYPATAVASQFADQLIREYGPKSGEPGKLILIAGHSNTIPPIAQALAATTKDLAITDTDFDNIFIVTVRTSGRSVQHYEYGAPTE